MKFFNKTILALFALSSLLQLNANNWKDKEAWLPLPNPCYAYYNLKSTKGIFKIIIGETIIGEISSQGEAMLVRYISNDKKTKKDASPPHELQLLYNNQVSSQISILKHFLSTKFSARNLSAFEARNIRINCAINFLEIILNSELSTINKSNVKTQKVYEEFKEALQTQFGKDKKTGKLAYFKPIGF